VSVPWWPPYHCIVDCIPPPASLRWPWSCMLTMPPPAHPTAPATPSGRNSHSPGRWQHTPQCEPHLLTRPLHLPPPSSPSSFTRPPPPLRALAALLKDLSKCRRPHMAFEVFDWLRAQDPAAEPQLAALLDVYTYTTMIVSAAACGPCCCCAPPCC
jgi:hypothetical protein